MVPNPGDYHVLEWRDNAQALIRNAGASSSSPTSPPPAGDHVQGRGNVPNVVCPIHRW
ncbi:MAG: aromatic ring-hydroxylating dioxygenase subunit alpha, partial [Betaproteobacteria bacterium]|nr:aromatic ring-hydroxylating dioxygenase subunit alpha [Betaproteobacteria bacterium]